MADQEPVKRRCATEVRRRGVDRRASVLKCKTADVVRQKREHIGREVQHHEVTGVSLPHQSTGQQRESRLHEEHEVSREERPREVGGNAEMPDVVGKLHGQWLSGRLSLEFVECLLVFRVIGSALIRRFRHDERIAACVGRRGLVASRDDGRIALRRLSRRKGHRSRQHICRQDDDDDLPKTLSLERAKRVGH
jgi:hypothetical protein